MTDCPELGILESKPWPAGVRHHVAGCGSCKLVMELIDERSQAAASRDRRTECARFEALIAVRAGAELHGAAKAMLDEHLATCADCRAIADTMAPADRPADHLELPAVDPKAYALGAEVARGGMGRILAARDLRIGRTVAVKELLAKSASLAARFEREARVTARLQHPGIVPIYEIGRFENGTPFYSMRLVEGKTLRAAIAEREGLEARLVLLPSVIAAAEAVAFAHAHDVVHRDLTPANIMVGEYGETVVIDWGLAKDLSSESTDDAEAGPYRRDPNAASDLTAVGAVLGTAAYMPPEQAAGQRVDSRADVYSLGGILYHLLAGHAPFKGSNDDVLDAVKRELPAPLPAATPRDLASIVTKAMAKEPGDRYPSAKELAAELTAFQAGRLVGAHEYTRSDLIRRWVRKRRGILAVATLALLALGAFGVLAIRRVIDERDAAEQQRVLADNQRAQSQVLSTSLLVEQGRQELLAGQHERAAALLAEAYLAAPNDLLIRQLLGFAMRPLEATERLQQPRITGATEVDGGARIQISPDGTKYVVRLGDRLWLADAHKNAPLVRLAEGDAGDFPHFSADSRYIAAAKGGAVNVWDATGRRVREIPLGRPASWIGFSPDGTETVVLAADGAWGVWSIATGERRSFLEPPTKTAFARPGANPTMATVGELFPVVTDEGNVVVWDWRRAARVAMFEHGAGLVTPFSTDLAGDMLITCGTDGRIKRWNVRTGQLLATLVESTGAIATCALARDGRVASSSITGTTRMWSPTGVATLSFDDEPGGIVRFSPDDGRLVIQNGMNRDITIRDAATGTPVARLGRSGILSMLGDRLFLVRFDGAVDVVALRAFGVTRQFPIDRPGRLPDGDADVRRVISDADDGSVVIQDLVAGTTTRLPIARPCSISEDGSRIAGWGEHGIAIVRATGEIEHEIAVAEAPYRIAIADDHRRVVAKFIDGRVVVWEVATGRTIGTLSHDGHDAIGLDHGRVVLTTQFGSWDFWDPETGKQTRVADVSWLGAISSDGTLVASSDGDGFVVVVDTHTGERRLTVPGGIFAAFDRANSVFVRTESEVFRWTTTTWMPSGRFPVSRALTSTLIASNPDGSLIATSAGLWETQSGRQLAAFDRGTVATQMGTGGNLQASLDFVSFSDSGDELRIQTSSSGRVWDVRPERRSAAEVAAIVARSQPWRVVGGQLTMPQVEDPQRIATRIRGRATYRGVPVAGAELIDAISGQYRPVGTTGADGTFELFRRMGRYTITVQDKPRGAFGSLELTASEHPDVIDIPLVYEASIAGRVIDGSGRPCTHAMVGADNRKQPDSGDAKTGADGTFRIGLLRGGLDYKIAIVDLRTGVPFHTRDALPQPHLADGSTHLEGLEIVVDDDPVVATDRIDPSVFNRLSTRWQPSRSLDVINEGDTSSRLVMQPTGAFSGQLWKLVPVGTAYRLSTQWQGDSKPLGIDGDRPRLVKNATQTWRIEQLAGGAYRIAREGDKRCLTSGLRLALVPCADTPDQQWLLKPTASRVR